MEQLPMSKFEPISSERVTEGRYAALSAAMASIAVPNAAYSTTASEGRPPLRSIPPTTRPNRRYRTCALSN